MRAGDAAVSHLSPRRRSDSPVPYPESWRGTRWGCVPGWQDVGVTGKMWDLGTAGNWWKRRMGREQNLPPDLGAALESLLSCLLQRHTSCNPSIAQVHCSLQAPVACSGHPDTPRGETPPTGPGIQRFASRGKAHHALSSNHDEAWDRAANTGAPRPRATRNGGGSKVPTAHCVPRIACPVTAPDPVRFPSSSTLSGANNRRPPSSTYEYEYQFKPFRSSLTRTSGHASCPRLRHGR